jgi:hypothetical protein
MGKRVSVLEIKWLEHEETSQFLIRSRPKMFPLRLNNVGSNSHFYPREWRKLISLKHLYLSTKIQERGTQ